MSDMTTPLEAEKKMKKGMESDVEDWEAQAASLAAALMPHAIRSGSGFIQYHGFL